MREPVFSAPALPWRHCSHFSHARQMGPFLPIQSQGRKFFVVILEVVETSKRGGVRMSAPRNGHSRDETFLIFVLIESGAAFASEYTKDSVDFRPTGKRAKKVRQTPENTGFR